MSNDGKTTKTFPNIDLLYTFKLIEPGISPVIKFDSILPVHCANNEEIGTVTNFKYRFIDSRDDKRVLVGDINLDNEKIFTGDNQVVPNCDQSGSTFTVISIKILSPDLCDNLEDSKKGGTFKN